MRTPIAIPLALALSALACDTPTTLDQHFTKDARSTPATRDEYERKPAVAGPVATGLTGAPTANSAANPAATPEAVSPGELGQGRSDWPGRSALSEVEPMLVRSGTASIRIDSLEPAIASLRVLAARVGGFVANTAVQAGPSQYRQATLEVRVPASRFDDLVTGLQPLGTVEAVNVTADDVGEEFVDVGARVANAKRLESRLIDLLATRTGRLQDVLSVERELARVREEIERYEGRLRYLRTRAATSSLSIMVHEAVPVVGDPGSNVLVRAVERAWRNFVELVAAFIASLGVLVPVLLAGGTVVWGVRRWRRPRVA